MSLNRREFLHVMAVAAAAGMLPAGAKAMGGKPVDWKKEYDMPLKGNVRLIHTTDSHAQLKPIHFREPNVNLGVGPAHGQRPHIVGKKLLESLAKDGVHIKEGSPEAYAFTYLDFDKAAKKYGKLGGYAHMKTLIDRLREQAGAGNSIHMDGGDTWHGSATALWTRGMDMVEATNILGVDVMTGHWEFTYEQEEVVRNLNAFKGEYVSNNTRLREDALFGDEYLEMTERHGGHGMYDEEKLLPFKPYTIKTLNSHRVAVIGQTFPRMSNANPIANFPDWSFGLREEEMQETVDHIKANENVAAIVVISHNGMDVDIKMAGRVSGIDAIFGGHTHDGMPAPTKVKRPDGGTCYVTNAGSNGKFVGVMDLNIKDGKLAGVEYRLLPVFANVLPADPTMQKYIDDLYMRKYDENVVEARNPKFRNNKDRLGKTFGEILGEELAIAGDTLYRRGNFMGTWDQIIVNALREEHNAQIAMSAGVRWGTSVMAGEMITMERLMDETSLTYGETYRTELTGAQLKDIFEGIAENLFVIDPYLQSGGDMVRLGGMDYTIDPNEALGNRITNMVLDDGTPIEMNKTYSVTGWAQVDTVGDGRLVWDIVADYLRREAKKNNGVVKLSKVNHPTLIGVDQDPGLADYAGKTI
ncbi:5'-nucleotidase C-terminal domain-containing protein [Thiomicrospira microaerophila]|uniref:5'-nucleotidase C-terminal domain-containing protein n=1 Tax=Thiomicrospira microaerophila TaxID=406020 RepID=UPI0005C8A3D1|nr:5'-nucleotidase C-terminal domain-containing protein [Thiomicrospira microaerophila]